MKAALILIVLLAGCASGPQTRAPAGIEVDKVVAVQCAKSAPARPAYATEALPQTATDIEYGDALAGDWVLSRGYERELEVIAKACAGK